MIQFILNKYFPIEICDKIWNYLLPKKKNIIFII